MIASNSHDFQCDICWTRNTDSYWTTIYGHFPDDAKIGERAAWIHGLCKECFFNSRQQNCFQCENQSLNQRVLLDSAGVIFEMDSRQLNEGDLKSEDTIARTVKVALTCLKITLLLPL